jgi:hypothetical protein
LLQISIQPDTGNEKPTHMELAFDHGPLDHLLLFIPLEDLKGLLLFEEINDSQDSKFLQTFVWLSDELMLNII